MKNNPMRFIPLVVALLASTACRDDELAGRASVIDGDTLEIHGHRIRLHGIDAPESRQLCFTQDGKPWRCGQRSAVTLADYLGASTITCSQVATDSYGRIVATCAARGSDLGQWLVAQGLALAYRRYSADYADDEVAARAARRGLWEGTMQPPWEWRKQHRREAVSPSPSR